MIIIKLFLFLAVLFISGSQVKNQNPRFTVVAFHDGEKDQAHESFDHEAEKWFTGMATKYKFSFKSTSDWNNLNPDFLSHCNVVIFLDSRPDSLSQRVAFQQYMENGGAWMGFHFAAFALTPSDFPQNWDWYHNKFLGSGEYKGNTWRPTSAVLRIEDRKHPAVKGLPEKFIASPNEWYRWQKDLRLNPDIKILILIDSTSFPLGTGPKQYEIWHSGYYPVVWINRNYRMIYFNMGHNDLDYENKTNRELSFTFNNKVQDKLIIQSLLWLAEGKKIRK
ncbi:MAG: ThuA domain-containing protein [Bacteroidota bacterium]|nr:ThuA domain-containing protein [Bacteroidota bacterium]